MTLLGTSESRRIFSQMLREDDPDKRAALTRLYVATIKEEARKRVRAMQIRPRGRWK